MYKGILIFIEGLDIDIHQIDKYINLHRGSRHRYSSDVYKGIFIFIEGLGIDIHQINIELY